MNTVSIYDHTTGLSVTRNMNADELAVYETMQVEVEAQAQADSAKDAARQAVLDKLGLTADEAQALLG